LAQHPSGFWGGGYLYIEPDVPKDASGPVKAVWELYARCHGEGPHHRHHVRTFSSEAQTELTRTLVDLLSASVGHVSGSATTGSTTSCRTCPSEPMSFTPGISWTFNSNSRPSTSVTSWMKRVCAPCVILLLALTSEPCFSFFADQQNYLYLQKFLQFERMKLDSFKRFELPTSHMFGPHVMFPQLATFHPFGFSLLSALCSLSLAHICAHTYEHGNHQ